MKIDKGSMLSEGSTLLSGTYRIDRQIASGGFGNTYVVTDVQLEEQYAMKEFFMRGINERRDGQTTVSVTGQQNRPQFEAQREKFKKEARRLRRLTNAAQPNAHLVKVKQLFEENDTAYYVMEFVDGESLSQRLKRTGKPLSEAEALDIVRQVLDGLATVHAQQIWHLDLKPANILIERGTGRAVIIDFGASKQLSQTDGYTTTATAMAYTQGYAPSEQIEQKMELIGPWTDFYALGATLYNLLTGHTPPSLSEMLSSQAFRFPASTSPKTQHLVKWLMKPNRSQRPQTVQEILDFLDSDFDAEAHAADDSEDTVLEPPVPPAPDPDDRRRPIWRHPAVVSGIVAALAVIAAIIFWPKSAEEPKPKPDDVDTVEKKKVDVPQVVTRQYYENAVCGAGSYTGPVDSDGQPHGAGRAEYADGRSYEGPFVHGIMEGDNGLFTYANGDTFRGTLQGNYFANGTFTQKETGTHFVGTFKKGKPDQGTWYDKDGQAFPDSPNLPTLPRALGTIRTDRRLANSRSAIYSPTHATLR